MEKQPLEKVIGMLEKMDIHEWESSLYLNGDSYYYHKNGNPALSINFQGLSFHLVKFYKWDIGRAHYCLEVSNLEKDLKLFSYNKGRKLLQNLYEKTLKKLKDDRQKESEKNIEGLKEKLNEVPE